MASQENYIEKSLIKVTDPENYMEQGVVTYWAVDDDTFDNMVGVDYGRMNHPKLRQITMDYLGTVRVQKEEEEEDNLEQAVKEMVEAWYGPHNSHNRQHYESCVRNNMGPHFRQHIDALAKLKELVK